MDDALYRAALIVFHQELGLPLIEAGRFASAIVVWSAETPKARAAVLEVHGPALRASDTGRSEAEAMAEEIEGWKRVATLAAVPLESYRIISQSFPAPAAVERATAPDMQEAMTTAVLAIRMAITGEWLPPFAHYDDLTKQVRARAALNPPAGQGEPETPHPHARGRGHGDGGEHAG